MAITPQEGSIEKVVEDAVRAQVQQMIVTSLESVDGLTARIVSGALQTKVKDSDTYREIPFIEKLCKDAIKKAAETAVTEWITEQQPALVAEVKRQLTSQKAGVAQSLVQSFIGAAASGYRLSFKIETPER